VVIYTNGTIHPVAASRHFDTLTSWLCENTLQGPNEAEQHPNRPFGKILRQGLDENLHAPTLKATGVATTTCASLRRVLKANTKMEDEMQSRPLLNVVIGESTTILQLFTTEDKTLLVRRDTCLESSP